MIHSENGEWGDANQAYSLASKQVPRNTNNTTHKDISPLDLELDQTIKHLTATHQLKLLPSRSFTTPTTKNTKL